MGAFDLVGSLRLNAGNFFTTMARADARMTQFAERTEHHFTRHFDKYFGTGFIAGALLQPFEKLKDALFGGGEMASEIDKNAKALRVSAEEYQMIEAAAKDAGLTVDEFMKSVGQSGAIDQAIQNLERYRQQITLTDEDVENLADADGGFWERLKKFGAKADASVFKALVDGLAAWQLQAGGMSQEDAIAGIVSDDKSQSALRRYRSKDRLRDAFLAKAGAGMNRPDFGINEWQKIGAFVGADTTQDIVKHTQATADAANRAANAAENIEKTIVHRNPDGGYGIEASW